MRKIKAPSEGSGWGQIQIGTSSLILIFTVLCLVIFSTLSLASAEVDQRLADKNQRYVLDYYAGDARAEAALKVIDSRLEELIEAADSEAGFKLALKDGFKESYDIGTNHLTYQVDLNSEQFLLVKLEPVFSQGMKDEDKNYKIRCWVVINKIDYEIDDDMPVWDGEILE